MPTAGDTCEIADYERLVVESITQVIARILSNSGRMAILYYCSHCNSCTSLGESHSASDWRRAGHIPEVHGAGPRYSAIGDGSRRRFERVRGAGASASCEFGFVNGRSGSKIAWLPTRRQVTCGIPWGTRPGPSVISYIPGHVCASRSLSLGSPGVLDTFLRCLASGSLAPRSHCPWPCRLDRRQR
jgi:hypothetical protein